MQVLKWGVVLGTALRRNYAKKDWAKGKVKGWESCSRDSVYLMVYSEAGRAISSCPELRQKDWPPLWLGAMPTEGTTARLL